MTYSGYIKTISYELFVNGTEELVATEAQEPFYPGNGVTHAGEVGTPVSGPGELLIGRNEGNL